MLSLALYTVALIVYAICTWQTLAVNAWPKQDLIPALLGFFGLLTQVHGRLEANYLRYFFFWTRLKQRITNPTSKWALNIDYRGNFANDLLEKLKEGLADGTLLKYPVRIFSATDGALNFSVNDSLQFFVELHRGDHNGQALDQCCIRMATIEIGSNAAREKIEREIIPILDTFRGAVRAEREAYTLNIDFLGANPFYSRYLQHLRADAIADFKIALQVSNYTAGAACERVEIDKSGVSIMAHTLTSMKELAKDFLFQSPNLGKMLPIKHA